MTDHVHVVLLDATKRFAPAPNIDFGGVNQKIFDHVEFIWEAIGKWVWEELWGLRFVSSFRFAIRLFAQADLNHKKFFLITSIHSQGSQKIEDEKHKHFQKIHEPILVSPFHNRSVSQKLALTSLSKSWWSGFQSDSQRQRFQE